MLWRARYKIGLVRIGLLIVMIRIGDVLKSFTVFVGTGHNFEPWLKLGVSVNQLLEMYLS